MKFHPEASHSCFLLLACFGLVCSSITLHSLGFSEFLRCVGNVCHVAITHVNKFVMLVPVETVLVLGKGPVHVEKQVSYFFFFLNDKLNKKSSSLSQSIV